MDPQSDPRAEQATVWMPPPGWERPSDNLALAIVAVFMCAPTGIVSIWHATKVESAWFSGNYEEARMRSRKSFNWGLASLVLFPLALIPCLMLV